MQDPEKSGEKSDENSRRSCPRRERAPYDSEQSQSGQNVNRQICNMIAPHFCPTEGIVDRQGNVQYGPAARSRVDRRRKRGAQVPDGLVVCDRDDVVERNGTEKVRL